MKTKTLTYLGFKKCENITKILMFIIFFTVFPSTLVAQKNILKYSKNSTIEAFNNPTINAVTLEKNNKFLSDVSITVTKSTKFQTIDGFGFFGAQDVWWSNSVLISEAWADLIISDLGVTIWRNELYPPADSFSGQDADWAKQKPVVLGIKNKALQYGVPLKYIFTVWSPPSALKCKIDNAENRLSGTPHPGGTKQGGALDPAKYTEFASWLKAGIKQYADEGINIFAISPQNEPFFEQFFNSCFYKQSWYVEMMNGAMPAVKLAYPNVKIFGSENMLHMEGAANNLPWFYQTAIKNNASANNLLDIVAIHGYNDGIAATSGSLLNTYWTNLKTNFTEPFNKKAWMTETSGYGDSWENVTNNGNVVPGAFSLAQDIYSGLKYGNMSGWVWWQGSGKQSANDPISPYSLMDNLRTGKKYAASKHYYRYIRPDAKRVEATSSDNQIFVTAYEHVGNGTNTMVLINNDIVSKAINVSGANLPSSFTIFRSSSIEDCLNVGTYNTGSSLILPARSIVTLQAGGTPLGNNSLANNDILLNDDNFSIFPNPITHGKLSIITKSDSPKNIIIYDLLGKKVFSEQVRLNEINITNLEAGIYNLSVEQDNKTFAKKIIIK